jgi:hypothetical protein
MENKENLVLSKFEKIRGYSSDKFCGEEWSEFYYFQEGYKLALKEVKASIEALT